MIRIPSAVENIIARLNAAGYEAFAVGGCVRDALRGVTPNDWDITTSALPEQTIACFAGERIIETGIKHGTVTLLQNGEPYEITTYRVDGEYTDARHPKQVSFVQNLTLDLARRDFTVNAMAYHPQIGIVDPFGGEQDLNRKILRCVGVPEERFTEDALRIMRALRFASTLECSIDPATAEAIHALKDRLSLIAVERIAAELNKLLCGNAAQQILLDYEDVIFAVIPEIAACHDYEQNTPYHDQDVWKHTVESVSRIEADTILRLTMLLHDVGKPHCYTETVEYPYLDPEKSISIGHFSGHAEVGAKIAEKILRRLRYDTVTVKTVGKLIEYHSHRPKNHIEVKKLLSQLGADDFFRLLKIRLADDCSKREDDFALLEQRYHQMTALANRYIEAGECLSVKQLAVTGEDLMKIGIPKGVRIGKTLAALLDTVLEEQIPNEKESLLQAAKQINLQ